MFMFTADARKPAYRAELSPRDPWMQRPSSLLHAVLSHLSLWAAPRGKGGWRIRLIFPRLTRRMLGNLLAELLLFNLLQA
jgi:hypothetical protein